MASTSATSLKITTFFTMFPKDFSHKSEDEFHSPLKITWGTLTDKNVKQLQVLNSAIFPIKYNDQFYKDAVNAPSGFVKLAYFNEVLVAAVCCRKEIFVENHGEFHNRQQANSSDSTEKDNEGASLANPPPHPNGNANNITSNTNINSNLNPPPTSSSLANSTTLNNNPPSPSSSDPTKFSLYILTLGVLAPYRERGIGKLLIEHVLNLVETSPACKDVVDIYLHVQEGNDDALRFYDRYGFKITEKLNNYYRRIEPADCFVVRKSINTSR